MNSQVKEAYARFLGNIAQHERVNAVHLMRSQSRYVLNVINDLSLDFAYIDGSHKAFDVCQDGLGVWPKIKSGGLVIFDDYMWEPDKPRLDRPQAGIDAFLSLVDHEIVHHGYQIIVKK